MKEKSMSFARFMQTLRNAELYPEGDNGIEFTTLVNGCERPFLAITPCRNIRTKNFLALFHGKKERELELMSIYIVEDCPGIFDKQNRSEFFDAIRQRISSLTDNISLLAYSSNGLNIADVGNRTQLCIAGTVMLEYETLTAPVPPGAEHGNDETIIRYRSVDYLVRSQYFLNVSEIKRRLFAYQFVGNVYATRKSETA